MARFARSHGDVLAAIECGEIKPDTFAKLVAHDSYHAGQVTYLRALQGLPPLD